MSTAKTIVKNAGVLAAAETVNCILSFLLIIVIARTLGEAGLGKYSFAFAFIGLFILVSDFGLSPLLVREIAKDRKLTGRYFRNYLSIKIFLSLLLVLLPAIAILFLNQGTEVMAAVFLAAVAMAFNSMSYPFLVVFNAFERMEYVAWTRLIERIFAFCAGLYVLLSGYGLIALMWVFVFSNLIGFIYSWIAGKRSFVEIGFGLEFGLWKKLFFESWPFWLSVIFITVYFRIDTVMLSLMKGYTVTGWYNAAYKIIDILYKVPTIIIVVLFPALSRFNVSSSKITRLLYERAFHYLFLLAFPIGVGISLLAREIILFVYKEQFLPSVIALQVLIWASVFMFINYLMGYLLNSIGKQRLFTYSTGICCIINIILNLLLIPKYSYMGAGVATVITEVINFGMLYYLTKKNSYWINIPKIMLKPVIAGILMGGFILYFAWINLFLLIFLSAAFYAIILIILKDIGREERDLINLLVRK